MLFGITWNISAYRSLTDTELLPIIDKIHPSERHYAKQQADYIISQVFLQYNPVMHYVLFLARILLGVNIDADTYSDVITDLDLCKFAKGILYHIKLLYC